MSIEDSDRPDDHAVLIGQTAAVQPLFVQYEVDSEVCERTPPPLRTVGLHSPRTLAEPLMRSFSRVANRLVFTDTADVILENNDIPRIHHLSCFLAVAKYGNSN